MSSNDAAYRLAVQKNRDRLTQSPINSGQISDRLEQITEEFTYWKKRLTHASPLERQTITEKLIALRAEQTTQIIQDLHESSPILAKQKTRSLIAAYYRDCARLMAATNYSSNG